MKPLTTGARLLLGALLVAFGLNGFVQFMEMPAMPEEAGALLGAMARSGYLMEMVHGVEVVTGALLLANTLVPLALILLAPVTVNILAFHAFLAPAAIAPGLTVAALQLFLAWRYSEIYAPLLDPAAELETDADTQHDAIEVPG